MDCSYLSSKLACQFKYVDVKRYLHDKFGPSPAKLSFTYISTRKSLKCQKLKMSKLHLVDTHCLYNYGTLV